VRLDHLLSKEHLDRKSGPGAHGSRMPNRGAQRRRHWPVRTGNGSPREYDLFGGAESSVGDAAGEGDKREHPVGYLKEQPVGLVFNARHGLVIYTVWESRPVGRVPRGLVGGCGLWVGRWLRIAQWTRASCFLWLSCQGRTVDALAPGADEGRGRPR
jgi:hypothetical protein